MISRSAQRVPIDLLDLIVTFAAGEAIHTEDSYKYSAAEIDALAAAAGLACEHRWLDGQQRFAGCLFAPT